MMSPANYWEVLVRSRAQFGQAGVDYAQALMDRAEISIVPADAEMARSAADAFARYKGRAGGRLNMGDSFAYALAAREGDGLLFKGDDFTRTDIKNALADRD